MTKIVFNACYGGFSLSTAAQDRAAEMGLEVNQFGRDVVRHDPRLVRIVEELGDKASGGFADLQIAEVPAGSKYRIDEYDGIESVMTPDDYEWVVAP